jgi:hypothetical protein
MSAAGALASLPAATLPAARFREPWRPRRKKIAARSAFTYSNTRRPAMPTLTTRFSPVMPSTSSERNHLAGVIAVVDDGGWPILLLRMDNAAYVASVELAPGKARTAALFKKPSGALEDAINHGRIAAVTVRPTGYKQEKPSHLSKRRCGRQLPFSNLAGFRH